MLHRRFFVPLALLLISLPDAFSQPFIISQPISQSRYIGQTVTFTVLAQTTAPPLRFQWQKDNASITGATNSLLSVPGLQSSAGAYIVIVSDNTGASVTSSPPAILVVKPPDMSIALHPAVTIEGAVGLTYGIQFTTDPGNTNTWQGLTNITLIASPQTWYDPQPAALPKRFYRILQGPTAIP